jgi:hypothetical protein
MNNYRLFKDRSGLFILHNFEENRWSVLRMEHGKIRLFGGINRANFRLICSAYSCYGQIQEDFDLD